MNKILVTYDLNKPEQNHVTALIFLKHFQHLQIANTVFIIETKLSIGEFWSKLAQALDTKDDFYAFEITTEIKAHAPESTMETIARLNGFPSS